VEPAVYGTETAPFVLLYEAVPIVGALGLIPGVIEFDEDEASDSTPLADTAVTVKVTAVPAVRPVTVIGELAPVAV
jgi:hypothetical protein